MASVSPSTNSSTRTFYLILFQPVNHPRCSDGGAMRGSSARVKARQPVSPEAESFGKRSDRYVAVEPGVSCLPDLRPSLQPQSALRSGSASARSPAHRTRFPGESFGSHCESGDFNETFRLLIRCHQTVYPFTQFVVALTGCVEKCGATAGLGCSASPSSVSIWRQRSAFIQRGPRNQGTRNPSAETCGSVSSIGKGSNGIHPT